MSPEPIHRHVDQRLPRSLFPVTLLDEDVVDVSVRSVREDLRPLENRREEESDRNPVNLGREAEAVLAADVIAREALPLAPPSRREGGFHAAERHVILCKLFPHSRASIQIAHCTRPNAYL